MLMPQIWLLALLLVATTAVTALSTDTAAATARAYVTTIDQQTLFALQEPVPLGPVPSGQPTVKITTSKRYQSMVGFGAAITGT